MSKSSTLRERFGSSIASTIGGGPGAGSPPPDCNLQTGPDKYSGAVKSRSFAELPLDALVADAQTRTEFDEEELARLATSIKRFGQLAPIRARWDEDRGKWVVLVGERRLRACRMAGLDRIRVEFVDRPMTEADILAEQVVENAVRADLQPVEQARAFERLMAINGWNAQQLAETIGVEPTSVYRSLGLLRLPADVAERVDAGEIRPTAAYEISKLQIADDQREVAAAVAAGDLDHAETAAEVRRRREAGSGPKKRRPKRSGAAAAGPVKHRVAGNLVVTVGRARGRAPLTDAEVVAALREALARVEGGDRAAAA